MSPCSGRPRETSGARGTGPPPTRGSTRRRACWPSSPRSSASRSTGYGASAAGRSGSSNTKGRKPAWPAPVESSAPASTMARTDRTLEVGFLGAGFIADWHATALRAVRGVRLAAACDRDEGRARALAARYGVDRVYTSLGEMLAGPRLDAIHVLLPPDAHARAAGEIIDSGTHVLLEKPMVTR